MLLNELGPVGEDKLSILEASIRDLAALSALPAHWIGREPPEVVESLLDILVTLLRLDLAYARVDPTPGVVIEAGRSGGAAGQKLRRASVEELGQAVSRLPALPTAHTIRSPLDGETMRVVALPLSSEAEGIVVTGSKRPNFPTGPESLLLRAVLNHATLWIRLQRDADRRRVDARLAETADPVSERNGGRRVGGLFGNIVGKSQVLADLLAQVDLVAPTDATVLILGESGTGKELFAREIHERSRRASGPLVKVNCSAIPRSMFESEFFGHVRGAFTGAVRDRPGRFKLAHKGTIFLDEVGELPLELQPKLLRVLQEGQYERVGDDTTRSTDVRVVAATNRDLGADVEAGRFREDLYYRLSVFPLRIPPLRDRTGDIAALAAYFAERAARDMGVPAPQLQEQHIAELTSYPWPGNVRELENVIERAVILARGGELRIDQILRPHVKATGVRAGPEVGEIVSDKEWRRRERLNLLAALEKTSGRIYGPGGAAALLGVKPSTLQSRLRALGIRARDRT